MTLIIILLVTEVVYVPTCRTMSRTRTIDVHVDWFVVILRLQVEQLGHHQARVLICHLSIKFIIIDMIYAIISMAGTLILRDKFLTDLVVSTCVVLLGQYVHVPHIHNVSTIIFS